jgi:hypothetical protein
LTDIRSLEKKIVTDPAVTLGDQIAAVRDDAADVQRSV